MSKQKKQYDALGLFKQGLAAFAGLFKGVSLPEKSALTNKQMRVRKAFKAACAARRLQRKLQQA